MSGVGWSPVGRSPVGGDRYRPSVVEIPGAFVEATVRREGEAGRRWLESLPSLVDALLERWRCRVDGPARHGEVALVVPVTCPSSQAVLKVSFPHPGNQSEPGALRQFAGRGTVRLLEADENVFALLLERAGDRTLAAEPSAEQAIEIAGALARRLAVPAAPGTFSLADTTTGWAEQLEQQLAASDDPPPARAVDRARETIAALGGDRTTTLLHRDLHDGNVLAADREPWLAIDPKGWRGTAAYDAFTVIAGRAGQLHPTDDLDRQVRARIRRYSAAAGVDHDLAAACCQARATSSLLYQQAASRNWFEEELLRRLVLAEL